MTTVKKVLLILVISCISIFSIIFYAQNIAPRRYTTRIETIQDEKIPEALNDMKIVFFSDCDYGTYMNEDRLNNLVKTINSMDPDVVIFGGDLYDYHMEPDDSSNSILITAFNNIHAPYGKFAVYGDSDDASDQVKQAVDTVYAASGFEVLQNTSLSLHKGTSSSITLVGIDNQLNGSADIETAYANVSNNNYVITVCHTPDTCTDVPADLTDYFLAGHSHGGQIWYFFGAYYEPAYAINYLRGKNTISNSFTLDITNGTGTTGKDIRLFADAEIVVYELKKLEIPETQTEEKKESTDTEDVLPSDTLTGEQAAENAEQQSQSSGE